MCTENETQEQTLLSRTARRFSDVHERWLGEPMEQDLALRLAYEALQMSRGPDDGGVRDHL